ncbi:MAG: HAD hydrolase-like protein [Polyangiaceae bacterium]
MPSRPTVLLFDIDGTLVSTGGAGRRAIDRAFREHTGAEVTLDFSFAGMTDPAIVRRGLTSLGRPAPPEAIAAVLDAYLRALEQEVATAPSFVVHEGVVDILARAATWSRVALGLGTGNIKGGAKVKLGRASLFDRFSFGGFGCDAEDRAELLAAGAARGAAHLSVSVTDCRVVIIGDTPKDIAAARAIGAESIGVGTGPYSATDLKTAGATWSFDTLTHPGALEALQGPD